MKDLKTDVVIVGGGLTGISTAYMLARAGIPVVVLEANTIGSGATAKTTAFITQSLDTSIADLCAMVGSFKAKLIGESHGSAIDMIEEIIARETITCNFIRCPNYYYANSKKEFAKLEKDADVAGSLGLTMSLHKANDLPFPNEGFIEIPHQAKFDASAYIKGVAKAATRYGATIIEGATVNNVVRKKDSLLEISTNQHSSVFAKKLVIATYYPFGNPKVTLFKKGMYVSYVLEIEIPKNTLPEAIYEDTSNPYHYFRIDPDKKFDRMIIGGEDHRAEFKMNATKKYKALEEYVKKILPGVPYTVKSRWTGPILEPSDGLALIGEVSENQFVATAFSGNGMTYATIAGMLLSDLILGLKNPWKELYDPKRIPSIRQLFTKGRDYMQEFIGGVLAPMFK